MPTERPTGPLLGEYQPATAKFRCGFRFDPFAVASNDSRKRFNLGITDAHFTAN